MSKTASVSFTTQKQDKPTGVIIAGYCAVLMLAGAPVGAPVLIPDAASPCVFTITEPGSYVVEVARCDDTGSYVSPAISSDPFVIAPDQIDVPLTVTVSIA